MKFNQSGYGASKAGTDYWSTHRSKISDLYKSEQYFFNEKITKVKSALDIGCAAGGSLCFARELNPTIEYFGADISEELIEIAKSRFSQEKNVNFLHYDGENIPLMNNHVEFTFSFGVFHHLNDWKKTARELLRVSSDCVLFDLRLWPFESLVGDPKSYQKIALGESEWDGKTVIQYNLISFNEAFRFFEELKKESISVRLYGYNTKPTQFAVTPANEVLMLAVLLEKNQEKAKLELLLD